MLMYQLEVMNNSSSASSDKQQIMHNDCGCVRQRSDGTATSASEKSVIVDNGGLDKSVITMAANGAPDKSDLADVAGFLLGYLFFFLVIT